MPQSWTLDAVALLAGPVYLSQIGSVGALLVLAIFVEVPTAQHIVAAFFVGVSIYLVNKCTP